MPYIKQITLPSGSTYDIRDAEAEHYKGTLGSGGDIGTLPTASTDNKGDLYSVITAGTYAGKTAVVDDLFMSDGTAWILIQTHDTTYQTTDTVTEDSTALVTSGGVWDAINNLPEPMIFKGTLGTGGTITILPTASELNEGFTYKVITAGTYASQEAKVGDVFVSNGTEWILIPAGDTDSDTWRNIKINGVEQLGNGISTGAVDFINGTNTTVVFNSTGNTIAINATDTNTHRPIKVNGSDYLGDNTTPLELIAGTNITLTKGTGADEGKVTITAATTGTSYIFAEGTTDGAFDVTPAGGSTQSVPIHGLDNLAFKDSASGTFTPSGDVSTPTISVDTAGSTTTIAEVATVGSMPTYTVSNEVLTITAGAVPTTNNVTVKTGDASYTASQPTFTGTQDAVTVS